MKLTNYQIYQYSQELLNMFADFDLYIPAKANFLIQKNFKIITDASVEIEKTRLEIAQHYGTLDQEQNIFIVPPDKIEIANHEIQDLFTIEQELNICPIKLNDLNDIKLTTKQMQAIMFMIEE